MRNRKTTVCGVLASALASFSLTPGISTTFAHVLVVMSIAVNGIGHTFAADADKIKPPQKGKMKSRLSIVLIALAFTALAFCSGCITRNPDQAQKPDGSFPPAYMADTGAISNVLAKVQTGIQSSAPINPYAGLMTEAAAAIGALATAGSVLLAKVKSSQAKNANAAKQVMAQGVVKAGATQSVLEVASATPHFAEVAHQLNEATP